MTTETAHKLYHARLHGDSLVGEVASLIALTSSIWGAALLTLGG
jgi:hypothetical protein